jgi:hypothetical protein
MRDIEIPDLTAKTHRERGNVKTGNRFDTALSRQYAGPGDIDRITDRRNDTQSCDNYTSSGQHPTPASDRWEFIEAKNKRPHRCTGRCGRYPIGK